MDAVFIVDMVQSFFIPYREDADGRLCKEHRKIFWHYVRGWFALDFVASIPYDLVIVAIGAGRALKMLRMLRLVRVLRLGRRGARPESTPGPSQIIMPGGLVTCVSSRRELDPDVTSDVRHGRGNIRGSPWELA